VSETVLKRKLETALAAYQQDDLLRLEGLVDEIATLGPKYRLHAALLRKALKKKGEAEAAVAGELIQVLTKLEQGVL
jgi:hypothetical protein